MFGRLRPSANRLPGVRVTQQNHQRNKKVGLPPGTAVYTGDRGPGPVHVHVLKYGVDTIEERENVSLEDCALLPDTPLIKWVDIDGVHDVPTVQKLCEMFKIHPLTLEDILSIGTRPKIDEYDHYYFVVLNMLEVHRPENGHSEIRSEQVSLIFGENFVLTFQEQPGDVWDIIRKRLRAEGSRIRRLNADYLAYALLDAVVDHYFLVLEDLGEEIEELEGNSIDQLGEDAVAEIHELKRQLLTIRRNVWPLREVSGALQRAESPLIARTTRPFLRDLHDHVLQTIETTELYRESAVALLELYLAGASNRLNQVMKVLTVLTAVFIPVTFISSVYGMNFEYMPELHWRYGYFFALGLMGTVAVGMFAYFRRQDWL